MFSVKQDLVTICQFLSKPKHSFQSKRQPTRMEKEHSASFCPPHQCVDTLDSYILRRLRPVEASLMCRIRLSHLLYDTLQRHT